MEKHKKCKRCGANAEWYFDGDCYCEFCMRLEFDVQRNDVPHICEMCGDPLDDMYYDVFNSVCMEDNDNESRD